MHLPGYRGRPYTTFTFIANDGELDSASATVTVNIIPAPVIDASSLSVGANGAFSLTFYALSNTTYRVWASTDLLNGRCWSGQPVLAGRLSLH